MARFKIISVKYKPLQPYLVITAGGKQMDFTADIGQVLEALPMCDVENARIEVRVQVIRYSIIRRLKKDPLIDRELTLQSNASIRIVMGTFHTLAPVAALGGLLVNADPSPQSSPARGEEG